MAHVGHEVFISYSNKDSPLASQVCAALESAGLRCWIAPRDIPKGTLWPEAITTALEECPVVVLIFTANSNASPDVLNEVALATENNAARIVFQAETVPPSKSLKYYLHVVQWLDATAPPLKPHLRELVQAVRGALAAAPGVNSTPAVEAPPQPQKTADAEIKPSPTSPSRIPKASKPFGTWWKQYSRGILTSLGMLALGGIVLLAALLARGGGNPAAPAPTRTRLPSEKPAEPPALVVATPRPTITTGRPGPPPCTEVNLDRGWLSPVDGMGMLCVPAGEFRMGLPPGHPLSHEGSDVPQHKIWLSAFWVDKSEVTNAMYQKFLNESQIKPTENEGAGPPWLGFHDKNQRLSWNVDRWWVQTGFEDHPVALVSWYGAKAYCEWAGRRLLTEAEWEKAARGGDGRLYAWGNEPPDCALANFDWCARNTGTTPVGMHSGGGGPFGGSDLTGNLWEWVADWFKMEWYQELGESIKDPIGPQEGETKVFRGGSFMNTAGEIVSTFRDRHKPIFTDWSVGFRCGY